MLRRSFIKSIAAVAIVPFAAPLLGKLKSKDSDNQIGSLVWKGTFSLKDAEQAERYFEEVCGGRSDEPWKPLDTTCCPHQAEARR